jgi:UDP-glucose 4-epimerase
VYGNQEGVMDENKETHPENPYAFHKVFGEELGTLYSSLYSLPCVALRYFNVYGKGNHEEGSYAPVTARFLKAKRENKPLPLVGDGEQTRDFIHVEDVAHANVLALQLIEKKQSEIINICSGNPIKIIDIAHMVGGDIEHLPLRQEIKHSCGNPQKALELLGFSPSISLEEGIQNLLNLS